MFYIEKVPKMGLFWLSLFLCYLSLFYSGCHLMGKYMLFVMTLRLSAFIELGAYLGIYAFVEVG